MRKITTKGVKAGIIIGAILGMILSTMILRIRIWGEGKPSVNQIDAYACFQEIPDLENAVWTNYVESKDPFNSKFIVIEQEMRIEGKGENLNYILQCYYDDLKRNKHFTNVNIDAKNGLVTFKNKTATGNIHILNFDDNKLCIHVSSD